MEQGTGIEPAFTAWEAVVLPIYEPCVGEGIIAKLYGKSNHFLSNKFGHKRGWNELPQSQEGLKTIL